MKGVQRSNERPSSRKNHAKKNNRFLREDQRVAKLRQYRKMLNNQKLKVLKLSKKIARLKATKVKLCEKIGEHAKRGDISAIIHNLNAAYEKGLLCGKSKLLQFVKNISNNLVRKSPRYGKFTKQLYECIRIMGGPRTARFLATNLGGPSDDTQRRFKRKNQFF